MSMRNTKLISFAVGALAAGLIAVLLIVLVSDTDSSKPVAATNPSKLCTLIGCHSGVDVRVAKLRTAFPEAEVLRVCQEDDCAETVLRTNTYPSVHLPIQFEEPTQVNPELSILDEGGIELVTSETQAEVDRRYPNGEGCDDGTCINVALVYDVASDTWGPDANALQ